MKIFFPPGGLSEVICASMLNWKSVSSLRPLFSHNHIPLNFLRKTLNRPKSALMKSMSVILLLFFSLLLVSETPPSQSFCCQGCPWPSHPQPVNSCLQVSGPAKHLCWSASQSPVSESYHQCKQESHIWLVPCCVAPSTDIGATQVIWFQNYMRYFDSLEKIWDFVIFFLVVHHRKHNGNQTVMWLFSHVLHQQLSRQKVPLPNYVYLT